MPSSFITLFTGLLSVATTLISTVGIIPTMRVFWHLRNLTGRNTNLPLFLSRIPNLDPYVANRIIETITPHFQDCLNHTLWFNRINKIILLYFPLRYFRFVIFRILKFGIGAVLSTIGILWNESLQSITAYARYVKRLCFIH